MPLTKDSRIPKKILSTIDAVNKKYGNGTLLFLSDTNHQYDVDRIPTGIRSLDKALEGGIPKSSIVEFFGEPQSAKSTTSLIFAANVQKQNGVVAYLDLEHGFDPRWARRFGVNLDTLIFSQPDNGEQALNAVIDLIHADTDLIIVDSVAALTPMKELEDNDIESSNVALLARLMSKAMRMILPALKNRCTIIIFINQYTTPIGGLTFYGAPQMATKGGLALKQASRMRLEIVRSEWIKSTKAEKMGVQKGRVGQVVQIRVAKSKTSSPYRVASYQLYYYGTQKLQELGVEISHGKAEESHQESSPQESSQESSPEEGNKKGNGNDGLLT